MIRVGPKATVSAATTPSKADAHFYG